MEKKVLEFAKNGTIGKYLRSGPEITDMKKDLDLKEKILTKIIVQKIVILV